MLHLFSTKGRVSRKNFWINFCVLIIIYPTLFLYYTVFSWGTFGRFNSTLYTFLLFGILLGLPFFLVTLKRLHDRGMSGQWSLLMTIPVIFLMIIGIANSSKEYNFWCEGCRVVSFEKNIWYIPLLISLIPASWILFQCLFLKGTTGPNKYGPDPLAPKDNSQLSV
jgi:uncharacterized membrane protein YhaH (DUF805 family)